uniref:SAM-dependent methyltransferase n=1 Tax=Heligmosomoides polygyrus TaxID=6339 RepID=A0A183GWD3_HELPZ
LCLLKKGGLFFLAVPRGVDMVLFNAHRFYGRMRLAMIMAGFEWITTYRGTIPHGIFPKMGDFENPGMHLQDLYLLRKL